MEAYSDLILVCDLKVLYSAALCYYIIYIIYRYRYRYMFRTHVSTMKRDDNLEDAEQSFVLSPDDSSILPVPGCRIVPSPKLD